MIEAVIFDVDGTLIDSVDAHAQAWERAFARSGKDVGFAAIRSQIGKGGDQLLPVFLDEAELRRIGPTIEKARGTIFAAESLHRVKAFPRVADLLGEVRRRGRRVALASSSKADELQVYKSAAGIAGLTDAETSSSDADRSKPEPDIFAAVLERLGLAPSRAIVVGDTPYDATAARKAGLASIGVLCGGFPGEDMRAAGASRIYRDPADLLARMDDWLP